jgi:hypothetical protein
MNGRIPESISFEASEQSISGWIVWLVSIGTILVVVFGGSVSGFLGGGQTDRRPIRDVWRAMHDDLPEVGASLFLSFAYWLALAVVLAGVIAILWFTSQSPRVEAIATNDAPDLDSDAANDRSTSEFGIEGLRQPTT